MDKELTPVQARMIEVLESKRFWGAFILLGALLLIVGTARYFMDAANARKEQEAAEKLFEVSKLETEALPPQTNIFSPEFFKKRMEWAPEKKEKMRKILGEVASQFPTTAAAQGARLRLGVLNFMDTKYEEAIKNFDEVVSKGTRRPEDVSTWNALLGKGAALEMLKKWDEAIVAYDEVAKDKKNPVLAEALLGKVRCLTSLGRTADVAPLLKELRDGFAGGYYESAARAIEAYQAR